MRVPDIELLWWEGCPSTERARSELALALAELGLPGAEFRMREIRTEAQAQAVGFGGSPTILIDGQDLAGARPTRQRDSDPQGGLSCRIYRRRDGRISSTPDPEDLRDALRRAAARAEASL